MTLVATKQLTAPRSTTKAVGTFYVRTPADRDATDRTLVGKYADGVKLVDGKLPPLDLPPGPYEVQREIIRGNAATVAAWTPFVVPAAAPASSSTDGALTVTVNGSSVLAWDLYSLIEIVLPYPLPVVQAAQAARDVAIQKAAEAAAFAARLEEVVAGAPTALDTLDELAQALGDDANFAATVTTALNARPTKAVADAAYAPKPTGTPDGTKFYADDGTLKTPPAGGGGGADASVAAAPTGSDDTAGLQALIDAAANAGGGTIRLRPGSTYITTGLTMKSNIWIDLNGSTLQLKSGTTASVIATDSYSTLIGGDSTSGPIDWGIRNGYLDGNKVNQSGTPSTFPPVLAIYGRRYVLDNLIVRNGYGTGIDSQWSTTSPFQTPNGFESWITRVYVHSCKYDGLNFRGPHDTFMQNFYVVKCGEEAGAVPVRFPDASGRANGSNVDKFHIYGGNGYSYGLVINTAGMRISNFVVEGAQTAQVLVQASQVQLDGFHLYTGGIATGTAKGIQVGDSTHTGVNAGTIRGRIENCGGGAIDVTYMGWNNDIDIHHAYFASTTPTVASLGIVGTLANRNKFLLRTTDSGSGSGGTYAPTAGGFNNQVGPQRISRTNASDTRNLWELRDESNNTVALFDWRGRRRVNTFAVPTIAAGAGAGTSPTVAISGDDTAGKITITCGANPAAGTLATVTFSGVFGNAPHVTLTAGDPASAVAALYAGTSTSAFSVKCVGIPDQGDALTIFYTVTGA